MIRPNTQRKPGDARHAGARALVALACLLVILVPLPLCAQPAVWESRGIGGGGALYAPSINPADTREMYTACDMTGLNHTTDGALSWVTLPFQSFRALNYSRVAFTADPALRYAIRLDFRRDARIPSRSTDGGVTWTALAGDPTDEGAWALFADPHRTDRLIVAGYYEVYFSADGGSTFRPIFKNMGAGAGHVGGVFWNGDTVVVAVVQGLMVSSDGGASFALLTLDGIPVEEGIVSFTGAAQGATTRFFCTTFRVADIYPGITGGDHGNHADVYRLDFGPGARWAEASSGIGAGDHPFFAAMAENNVQTSYLAGGSGATSYPIVYKTTDGGGSWAPVFKTTNNENIATAWSGYRGDNDWWYGEYALGFDVALRDANTLVFTDLGFVHGSTDGGANWRQMYVDPAGQNPAGSATPKGRAYSGVGMENSSAWWIDWRSADEIFVGATDITAMRSTDAGATWSKNFTGLAINSVYCVTGPPGGSLLYAATSSVHDLYESTYLSDSRIDKGKGAVMLSADRGATWQTMHDFAHPVCALALDPAHPRRLYAAVVHSSEGGIYVSDDIDMGAASTWRRLAPPARTEGHPLSIHVLTDGTLMCSYSGRRNASGAFTASSGVFASTNGGVTWMDRSDPGMRYWTRDLVPDPHDAAQNTWYACVYSGWGGPANDLGGLYRTDNRGATWTRISDAYRVSSCTVDPRNAGEMYVTTEDEGLLYCAQRTAPVPSFVSVAGYPFQHPQRVFFNPYDPDEIWVTSFGNGLRLARRTGTDAEGPSGGVPGNGDLIAYPNPASGVLHVRVRGSGAASVGFALYDALGRCVRTETQDAQGVEVQQGVIDLHGLTPGTYLLRATNGRGVQTGKVLVR